MHVRRELKLLFAAQDQVVVLAALEPAPKASDIAREIGPDGREVADIVLAAQQVGIPIRLEVRIESSPLRIDLVLVGIDQASACVASDGLGHFEQRMRTQLVVMVDRKSTRLNSSH